MGAIIEQRELGKDRRLRITRATPQRLDRQIATNFLESPICKTGRANKAARCASLARMVRKYQPLKPSARHLRSRSRSCHCSDARVARLGEDFARFFIGEVFAADTAASTRRPYVQYLSEIL